MRFKHVNHAPFAILNMGCASTLEPTQGPIVLRSRPYFGPILRLRVNHNNVRYNANRTKIEKQGKLED